MASTTAVSSDLCRVRVGSGRKAHLFRPRPGANAKLFTLHDGGTAYDYVLCGASGALVTATEDLDDCVTCSSVLERDQGTA